MPSLNYSITFVLGDSLHKCSAAGGIADGMRFSTFDHDNDNSGQNCATSEHGAWWYNICSCANLNGRYYTDQTQSSDELIVWYTFLGWGHPLKSVQVMIK